MSRYHSYLNSAVQIVDTYNGEEPFAHFLKKFFSLHKKYGSTDRKLISHLCYCSFRLGKAWQEKPAAERIVTGLFFCSSEPAPMLETLRLEWNGLTGLSLQEKQAMTGFPGDAVFPWKSGLSATIDHEAINASFFTQPDLFLRIRPGKRDIVLAGLKKAALPYQQLDDDSVALPNASKIEQAVTLNKDVVIQDYNSQRIGELLTEVKTNRKLSVWDCCAASGGKSIMAIDVLGSIDLAVSDIRESILANLKKRFSEAGIHQYRSFCADLSLPGTVPETGGYDLIICDVPCTGSGTWGRTPEQLFYFDESRIDQYAWRQQQILTHVLPHLRPGGHLLYSTCSVFQKENEGIVDLITRQSNLEMIRKEVLKGYDRKADTLFAALLRKTL